MTCPLCDWAEAGHGPEVGSELVYADEVAVVLVDSAPGRRREAWVIPKAHYSTLSDMDERTGQHLFKLGMRAALSLGVGSGDDLQVLLEGTTPAADAHVHVRVYPRESA
jgi:diadenosine tetraphosphate (Ap4A) HIT family hydrolase